MQNRAVGTACSELDQMHCGRHSKPGGIDEITAPKKQKHIVVKGFASRFKKVSTILFVLILTN